MARRWTEKEIRHLFNGIGAFGLSFFKRNTLPPEGEHGPENRSSAAIYSQIRRLYGGGGLTRGVYTLIRLADATGYHRRQIERARSALNQKWKRTSPKGSYIITDEQADDIVEWLKHDYWNAPKRLYGCVWCATDKRPHLGQGLCRRCYYQHRRVCEEHGIPPGISGQTTLIGSVTLDVDNARVHGKFLDEASRRLERGLALDAWDIERLYMLQPGGADAG